MINNEKEHHTNKRKFQTPHIPDGQDIQNLNINKHDNQKDRIHKSEINKTNQNQIVNTKSKTQRS